MTPDSSTTATPDSSADPAASTKSRQIWIDGKYAAGADASVSVFDHGLLYGDGCFEGIRAYGGRIFKLRSHLERLFASAEAIRLAPAYTIDEIDAAVRECVSRNGLTDAYIRLVLTRGVGTLGLHPFMCPVSGTIIIADSISLYPKELYDAGLKVIVAQRPRVPIECLDPAIKSLNYLNNILAKIEAIDASVLEAIMLNVEGYVSECTGDNLFIIKGQKIATPPTDAGILHGITRSFIMETVAPACGYQVEQRMMRIEEVLGADEVFLTGTAAEVIGVTQVGDASIGGGVVGPITRQLSSEFRRRVAQDAPED